MRKRIGCFFFLFAYLAGVLFGAFGGGWLFPASKEGVVFLEAGQIPECPEEAWSYVLLFFYGIYFCLTVLGLDLHNRPHPFLIGWGLYGLMIGCYVRGLLEYYGKNGIPYGAVFGFVTPVALALLTGVFREKRWGNDIAVYYRYQAGWDWKNIKKWIQSLLNHLRIRLLPVCLYGVALLLCYILDDKIVKCIQWRFLFHMLCNAVD